MDAEVVRSLLLAQHDRIHMDLNRCCSLAQRLCTGEPLSCQLEVAIAQLRADLAQHDTTESELLGTLLDGLMERRKLLLENMLEEHLAEHSRFLELLSGSVQEAAMRMAELAHELEAHMAAEERTLLCPIARRFDVDTARGVPEMNETARRAS